MMKAAIYNRKTMSDLLVTAAETNPQNGIGFVQLDSTVKFHTHSELLTEAKRLAAGLKARGLAAGDKAMIVMTRNEDIVAFLWACLISRIIPTILQPPVSFTEFNTPARKIENVYRILERPFMILSADLVRSFHSEVISRDSIVNADEVKDSIAEPFNIKAGNITDIAFIQFSSGSTGDPKGIVLTHQNILKNLAAISIGIDLGDDDVSVNWMPIYHDMGLFGYHFCALFAQNNQYLIDPVDFVKKPAIWLDIMDQVKCTITGCPNFGMALLLRYLKNREDKKWDLSPLKVILNGAEPISTRIMTEFLEKLSVYGLRKEAMMPAYGMAEATLALTFSGLLQEPVINSFNRKLLQVDGLANTETENDQEKIELVSVGKALDDVEIRILDEAGHLLEEKHEGHIQIRGASVTSGYYNNPEETRNSFDDGWFITGDKGFFFERQLYITGRVKDIIFVRGQNLYAHDLENLAAKHLDIPYGKVIVGGWFDPKKGHDQIILFLVGFPNQAICDSFLNLRAFFRSTYGIAIDVFVPVRSNQVPKTSSGKIQRHKLIDDYHDGAFDEAIAEIKKMINLQP
jgi:acyl-CoA synthetase (AMP-forming)/AMP-acid ligase II